MENTFRNFRKKYRCESKDQAFEVLEELFGSMADLPFWLSKVCKIQNAVFDPDPDFSELFPDTVPYQGQLFLKLINACICLRDFPPVLKEELKWEHLLDDWIENSCDKNTNPHSFYSLMENCPRHLSPAQVLDPSGFIRKFFKRKNLKSWIIRWNHFRESAFFTFSITEGNEGEYHQDFQYFLKLTEASYLIYVRFSPTQKSPSHATI